MITKTADNKGRIALGAEFANKTFIIEKIDGTEMRIIEAAVIPQRELWLHKNQAAMESVQRGLEQAKQKRFAKQSPRLDDRDVGPG